MAEKLKEISKTVDSENDNEGSTISGAEPSFFAGRTIEAVQYNSPGQAGVRAALGGHGRGWFGGGRPIRVACSECVKVGFG